MDEEASNVVNFICKSFENGLTAVRGMFYDLTKAILRDSRKQSGIYKKLSDKQKTIRTDTNTNKSSLQNIEYCLTYIIGHYNPSVRIINQVSHTTCVVRVTFYT